jgi:co-chaperonin GroES (HSP10)
MKYLQPLGRRALVKRELVKKVGLLYVPDNSEQMKVCMGEVVAIGPDCEVIKEGDLVTFGRYAPHFLDGKELELLGVSIDKDTTEMLLLNEDDALCIIAEEVVNA